LPAVPGDAVRHRQQQGQAADPQRLQARGVQQRRAGDAER
jgi:hypothetical protein